MKKEKNKPKRAPTSIVASAEFPEEEIDFEEDSKTFTEDSKYDQYKVEATSAHPPIHYFSSPLL